MDLLDKNKSILHASVAGHITAIHPPPPGVSGMVSSDPGAVKPDLPNVLLIRSDCKAIFSPVDK